MHFKSLQILLWKATPMRDFIIHIFLSLSLSLFLSPSLHTVGMAIVVFSCGENEVEGHYVQYIFSLSVSSVSQSTYTAHLRGWT